jgi:hypothetical protein
MKDIRDEEPQTDRKRNSQGENVKRLALHSQVNNEQQKTCMAKKGTELRRKYRVKLHG